MQCESYFQPCTELPLCLSFLAWYVTFTCQIWYCLGHSSAPEGGDSGWNHICLLPSHFHNQGLHWCRPCLSTGSWRRHWLWCMHLAVWLGFSYIFFIRSDGRAQPAAGRGQTPRSASNNIVKEGVSSSGNTHSFLLPVSPWFNSMHVP